MNKCPGGVLGHIQMVTMRMDSMYNAMILDTMTNEVIFQITNKKVCNNRSLILAISQVQLRNHN